MGKLGVIQLTITHQSVEVFPLPSVTSRSSWYVFLEEEKKMPVSCLCYAAMAQAQLGKVAAYSEQLSKRLGLTSIYCLVEEASYQDHLQDKTC